MKTLNIVQTGYRATLEEQDDTVVWLLHAMKAAGAEHDVVLRNTAAGYAVAEQDASGLTFGERRQTQPPRPAQEVAKLLAKGSRVYVIEEDLAERGIERDELTPGLTLLRAAQLPRLMADYGMVWHW